jgi:hypothetical protein
LCGTLTRIIHEASTRNTVLACPNPFALDGGANSDFRQNVSATFNRTLGGGTLTANRGRTLCSRILPILPTPLIITGRTQGSPLRCRIAKYHDILGHIKYFPQLIVVFPDFIDKIEPALESGSIKQQ